MFSPADIGKPYVLCSVSLSLSLSRSLSLSLALPRCIYTLSSRITYGNHGFAMMCELQLVTDCHAAVQMVQVPTGFSVSMYDFSRH